jgi:hypothetical protein
MNYYFEERILDTRQNELWTLKNFKLNNLVVGNYLVAKNNEEWASMVSVRTRYIQYQSGLIMLIHIFDNLCCIYIFV